MQKKQELTEIQKQSIFLKDKAPVLWTGVFKHRTHRGNPLDFTKAHYLKDIYTDINPYQVIISCSQSGKSEYLIVRVFSSGERGRACFYVLPTQQLAYRFVKNRIDSAINNTPYYKALIKGDEDKYKSGAESVSLKHIGPGVAAFVGAGSEASMVEFPADDLIIDELDRCEHEENLAMAESRLSASLDPRIVKVSNPSIVGFGIDYEYSQTDMKKWFVKCPHCGKWKEYDFFKHILRQVDTDEYVIRDDDFEFGCGRDIIMVCDTCYKPLDRYAHGEWVHTTKSDRSGYQISKMFSSNKSFTDMVRMFDEGLAHPGKMQLFYNFDLGVAYDSPGAKITSGDIENSKANYNLPDFDAGPCLMGVDVGKVFNVVIRRIEGDKLKLVHASTPRDPKEIIRLWKLYNVKAGVIDAMPEDRIAKQLAGVLKGLFRCYYGKPKHDLVNAHKEVQVQRTEALDAVKEAFTLGIYENPKDIRKLPEYEKQMTASIRVYDEDKGIYEWKEGSRADHYLHAEAYCLVSKKLIKFIT